MPKTKTVGPDQDLYCDDMKIIGTFRINSSGEVLPLLPIYGAKQ